MSWWAPGRRALLIEDERLYRDVLRRFLLSADPTMILDIAGDLAEARTLLGDNDYDVVLADVRLPDGSGLDLAGALSTQEHAPPVVVVTGVDDRTVWARAADVGAVVVLPKASLSAERVAGALAFAFESTASQRASELTAEAATELSQGPDPTTVQDLLDRLGTALALDGASLLLERVPDGFGLRVEVGEGPDDPARAPEHAVDRRRDGWAARLELYGAERRWAPVAGALATFCDVALSSWRLAETSGRLADSEQRCRAIADATTDLIMTVDREDRLLAANAAALVALDADPCPPGESPAVPDPPIGSTLAELTPALPALGLAARLTAEVRRNGDPVTVVDQPVEADGLRRWYSGRALPGSSQTGAQVTDVVHVVLSDSTHRVLTEHELSTLALTDPLTGLANRRLAMDRLEHALEQLGRREGALFVATLDIDYFKSINDLNGHGVGDEVIKAVARRLSTMARRSDTCARLGGDEFLVVAEGVQGNEGGQLLATRIHEALSGAVTLPDRVLPISVSLGYVIVDDPAITAEEALRRSDEAVYAAKSDGRNRVSAYLGGAPLFDSGAELAGELRRANTDGRFRLRFQPMTTPDGRVVAAEALLRLDHERYGEVEPEHFLDSLLESPLVGPVGRMVASTAVEQLATWRADGAVPGDFRMHLNVAPHQLSDSGFVDHILTELARTGVPPGALALEITEQTLSELARRSSVLTRAAGAGIGLYLDGFGTGSSSIANLRSTTLRGIKIDRSLTAHLDADPRSSEIINGLVALSRQLSLDVVIQGVETGGHLARLDRCLGESPELKVQGYHLGRPMTPAEFLDHLRECRRLTGGPTTGPEVVTTPEATLPDADGRGGRVTLDLTDRTRAGDTPPGAPTEG